MDGNVMAVKYSRKREAIYQYLKHTKAHPDAETVYRALKPQWPDLSLGTVYRNLAHFLNDGSVVRIDSGPVCRYDANTTPHCHFSCTVCNHVYDVALSGGGPKTDEGVLAVGRADSCQIMFHGICNHCK